MAMEENKRIRLVFKDDDILSDTQKSDGLNCSWVLLKPHQHDTVSDVAAHLLHAFHLHQSCPNGLLLSISGFALPPFESTRILKDNEIIRVRKRRDVLAIAGKDATNEVKKLKATNEVKKLKAVEKQPVNTGVLLLANEEFEKEKGGYESDDPDEESEEDDEEQMLEAMENSSGGNADPKKRKRKAAEKIQGPKKKKQRSEATGKVAKDHCTEKCETSLQGGDLSNKKRHSHKEKKDGSTAEDCVENNEGTVKISDKSDLFVPGMKSNVEVQEKSKESEDANIAPKEAKKVPSRSARRKSKKRRWLKEMAKIQKQNATCESESLRNWKEDQAKAERKKVDGQLKGQHKWKKHQADAERNEVDGEPKGLLHLKLSPQNNRLVKVKKHQQRNKKDYFLKHQKQNGDVHEMSNQNGDECEQQTQNGDGIEQPNQKQGDVQEQPGKKGGVVQELPNENGDGSKQLDQESDDENEVVPIIIRPGHIRFEPLGKEQAVPQNHVPSETLQWNGITSKKKGQQWGKENCSFTPRNDYKHPNKEYSQISVNEKEKQPHGEIDFDKLPPLPSVPKEGDVIAYRVLELSSSWTPELSAYRVGKVSHYDAESNQTILAHVPEYPIVSKKSDEDEVAQPDNSLYKEDGSLEIDFSSLIDVRIINNRTSGQGNEALSLVSEGSIGNESTSKTVLPSSNDKQTVVPSPDNLESSQGKETQTPTADIGGVSIWEQVSEALNAKKEQLIKENGWGILTPKKAQISQDNSWGNNAKKVPQSPGNSWGNNPKKVQPSLGNSWGNNFKKVQPSWGNNAQKVQPSQDNSSGKQSSGGKSWSYKGLRGGGLASTMAMLRSRNES